MNNKEIISKIRDILFKEGDCFHSFVGEGYIFHKDYSKYDLMSICYDIDSKELEIEGVGYNSFGLSYFKAEELSSRTLNMILDILEKKFEIEY